ncbi:MAG: penicillin-binding transpeptidase domain-containing protein, partial [Devosia sp.]|nr:penicillin-binding transpeptidase domain-containing protein [Devosia sp.]
FEMLPDYTPKTAISDRPVCIGDWCPQNYGRNYKGSVTLESAFAASINTVPVTLSIKTGREPIAEMAHRMGIQNEFPITRSLALGVASVSVLDMTSAYAVFASGGLKTPAFGIARITTLRGEPVYEADMTTPHERVLSERTAAYMNHMLRLVVTNGTGRRAQIEGVPASGKTGTTTSYRDAWFCGFTGNYVAAVWFGNDDYRPTKNLTGGTLPTIAWQKFMAYAHTNVEIKPVFGVDFKSAPFVIASAEEEAGAALQAERPPVLQPEAARKLLDVADRLKAALRAARPAADQAALAAGRTIRPSESL